MNNSAKFETTIEERLDNFLTHSLNVSRNQVAQLIKKGAVLLDGKVVSKPGIKLKIGVFVDVTFPEVKETKAQTVDFDVEILYEDDDILVINKPSGLTVHPAPSVKEATLVDWLKQKNIKLSTISGEERHGIVHRLDKGTSGAMVVAKSNLAHEALSKQLQDRSMGRYYFAVNDLPLKDNTIVERAIARSPKNRLKMAVSSHDKAKHAKTAFAKVTTGKNDLELVACKLFSGRTHQIRVHLESISRHIIGDHLYTIKSNNDKINRIFLHAFSLYLVHPITGKTMEFEAPLDDTLKAELKTNFEDLNFEQTFTTSFVKNLFTATDDWMYAN